LAIRAVERVNTEDVEFPVVQVLAQRRPSDSVGALLLRGALEVGLGSSDARRVGCTTRCCVRVRSPVDNRISRRCSTTLGSIPL
jgi:hypothetical protein